MAHPQAAYSLGKMDQCTTMTGQGKHGGASEQWHQKSRKASWRSSTEGSRSGMHGTGEAQLSKALAGGVGCS